jgi:molybdopterin converting factor small subunit
VELTAEAIVELFRRDARARRELAVLLVSEPEVRLAIINAVLRDVATKSDIEALRAAVKDDIDKLRESLENRFEQHRSATKSDIEALRAAVKDDIKVLKEDMERRFEEVRTEFRRELDSVRREIDFLAREIDRLYRLVMVSVLGILISIATTILVRVLLPP